MIGLGETLSIGCALAWAIGVVIYKRLGDDLPPIKLNVLKNAIVLILVAATVGVLASPLAPWLGFERLPFPRLDGTTVAVALLSGLIGIALADTLYLHALNTLGAGRMGVIGNFYSPFVIVLSFVFLDERLTAMQVIGFLLVMFGVLLVNAPDGFDAIEKRRRRQGVLAGVASILLMAIAIVMVKRTLESEPFWWIVLIRVTGAVLGLSILIAASSSLRAGMRSTRRVRWGILLVAAFIGQYLSMTMWLAGYKYTSASIASILNETASIFIVAFAALFLREHLTRRKIAGVATTLAGVVVMVI